MRTNATVFLPRPTYRRLSFLARIREAIGSLWDNGIVRVIVIAAAIGYAPYYLLAAAVASTGGK